MKRRDVGRRRVARGYCLRADRLCLPVPGARSAPSTLRGAGRGGGGGGWQQTRCLLLPPPLSLPHKGGGNPAARAPPTATMNPRRNPLTGESASSSAPSAHRTETPPP